MLDDIQYAFELFLTPVIPHLGLPYTFLDVFAALRLCFILRQLRIAFAYAHHPDHHEHRSWARDVFSTLTIVFGGEAIFLPFLNVTPSWMMSPLPFALFLCAQSVVDHIPGTLIPAISWKTELPFSLLDGFSRAFLLCDLIPPVILRHADPKVANSSWSLIIGSVVLANGGFFLTSLLSLLYPTPISLRTPPELLPYGWMSVDLWVAPLISLFYTFLTGAQPLLRSQVGYLLSLAGINKLVPLETILSHSEARAAAAVLLTATFVSRTMVNMGPRIRVGKKKRE